MKKRLSLQVGVGIVSLGAISAIASSISPVAAIPYNTNTVYKTIENGITYVYISATPRSRVGVDMGNAPRTVARIVGSCGELRISPSTNGGFGGLAVDGTAIDASTLPTQTLPSCASGSFSEARASNFRTPSGQVVIVGKTPGAAASITLNGAEVRNVSVNACGFGILRPRTGETLPASFKIGTTDYTLATLPDAGKGPICRTANGISSGYVPDSW